MKRRHHDLVIVGTGSGNTLLGPEHDGLDVAIVEQGRFGGTCLNVGCIPTKMFVLPADRVVEAAEAARLGVTSTAGYADWSSVRDRIFGRIDPIVAAGERYRRESANVTVYAAPARFVGPMTLDTGTGTEVTADRWVIAAGARPRLLDVPGLDAVDPARGVHTSDTIMRIPEVPRRVVIVGGGFIAAEFAHVLDAFGAQVTWIHRRAQLLRAADEDVRAAVTRAAGQRFDLRLQSAVTQARRTERGWRLSVAGPGEETTVETDAVLLALGRTPNTDTLAAAAAGLPTHADGRLVVDRYQRTPVPGVFALGDVCSPYQLKHVANHEARVVRHNLAHPEAPMASDHRFVPAAVFGHPQVASFGPTEEQLRTSGAPYRVARQRYADVAYGWALEDQDGFVKVMADPQTGLLLAAHVVGPHASTVIQPLIQAASFGQRAVDVALGQYWIHPALVEVVENALLSLGEDA